MIFLTLNKDCEYFNASYGVVPKSVSSFHHKMLLECESNPYKWFTQNYKKNHTFYISIHHKTYLDMIIQFSNDEHNSNM